MKRVLLVSSLAVALALVACQPTLPSRAPESVTVVPLAGAKPQVRSSAESADQNRHYDAANPAYATLQKANEALAGFPVDARGSVDWNAALNRGMFSPRASVDGTGRMEVFDLDIVMKNTKEMPHVVFPHKTHTRWLACENCHDALFTRKAGANAITMSDIFAGRACGVCHDRVAFTTVFVCERCHSKPQSDAKSLW